MLMMQSSDFPINHIPSTAIYVQTVIKEIVKSNRKIAISWLSQISENDSMETSLFASE